LRANTQLRVTRVHSPSRFYPGEWSPPAVYTETD
jgi:hypothetical protein